MNTDVQKIDKLKLGIGNAFSLEAEGLPKDSLIVLLLFSTVIAIIIFGVWLLIKTNPSIKKLMGQISAFFRKA